MNSVMKHATYLQKGAFNGNHFLFAEDGKRPFSEAGAIERSRLIHYDLAVFQQTAAGCNGYSPLLESRVNLSCHGKDDNHRRPNCGKRIVLENQNRPNLANFLSAWRIQVGNPDLTATDYFHHFSPGSSCCKCRCADEIAHGLTAG